ASWAPSLQGSDCPPPEIGSCTFQSKPPDTETISCSVGTSIDVCLIAAFRASEPGAVEQPPPSMHDLCPPARWRASCTTARAPSEAGGQPRPTASLNGPSASYGPSIPRR